LRYIEAISTYSMIHIYLSTDFVPE